MGKATVLDGKALAEQRLAPQKARALALTKRLGRPPGLVVVRVGDDAASQIYVRYKMRRAQAVGMQAEVVHLPQSASAAEVGERLAALAAAAYVDAALLQLPLPPGLPTAALLARMDPDKDVDGLHPRSVAALYSGTPGPRPCTAPAVLHLLRATGRPLQGCHAVVVGRSAIVGRPIALLLLQQDATVTLCHAQTRDLAAHVRRADVLVVAAGSPELIAGDWIKEGATVIDVGINRREDGLCGDVDFAAAARRAAFITPVPGGVGPLTVAMVIDNALDLAAARAAAAGL